MIGNRWLASLCAAGLIFAAVGTASFAQGPGGRGGGPGGGMRGGFGGGRGMGMQRPITTMDISLSDLDAALKLSRPQHEKIDKIQANYKETRSKLMPQRPRGGGGPGAGGRPGGGRPGGPPAGGARPDMKAMMAAFQKMEAASVSADKSVDALLTAIQKKKLAKLKQEMMDLRETGFPSATAVSLDLNERQDAKLSEIAAHARAETTTLMKKSQGAGNMETARTAMGTIRTNAHKEARALLTDKQRNIIDDYDMAHPRGGFGGGGFGGGGFGGRGGGGGRGGAGGGGAGGARR